MKKVIIAVHHFPPRYAAGAELRAFRTAKWMRQNQWDARVVCIEYIDRGPANGVSWVDDVYETVPVRRLSFDLSKAPDRFRWEYDNPWIEEHFLQYLGEVKPDIFHLISGYLIGAGALRASQTLAVPSILTATDFWFLCRRLTLLKPNGQLSDPTEFDPQACARCKLEEKRRYRLPAKIAPALSNRLWHLVFNTGFGKSFGLDQVVGDFQKRDQVLLKALATTNKIICPTRYLIETLATRGVARDKLLLNSHGLDNSSWLPAEAKRRENSIIPYRLYGTDRAA